MNKLCSCNVSPGCSFELSHADARTHLFEVTMADLAHRFTFNGRWPQCELMGTTARMLPDDGAKTAHWNLI